MLQRVTHRSRPRIDDWVERAGDPVSPEAAYENGDVGNYALGPFTRDEIFELLFRIDKISISASLDWTDSDTPPESGTFTVSAEARRIDYELGGFDAPINDESRVLKYAIDISLFETLDESGGRLYLSLISPVADISFGNPIAVDTNGKYWLTQSLIYASPPELINLSIISNQKLSGPSPFSVNLALSNSTVVIKLNSYPPTGYESMELTSCSMAAEEWYPYADKEGNAVWDTATGLPVAGAFE